MLQYRAIWAINVVPRACAVGVERLVCVCVWNQKLAVWAITSSLSKQVQRALKSSVQLLSTSLFSLRESSLRGDSCIIVIPLNASSVRPHELALRTVSTLFWGMNSFNASYILGLYDVFLCILQLLTSFVLGFPTRSGYFSLYLPHYPTAVDQWDQWLVY